MILNCYCFRKDCKQCSILLNLIGVARPRHVLGQVNLFFLGSVNIVGYKWSGAKGCLAYKDLSKVLYVGFPCRDHFCEWRVGSLLFDSGACARHVLAQIAAFKAIIQDHEDDTAV